MSIFLIFGCDKTKDLSNRSTKAQSSETSETVSSEEKSETSVSISAGEGGEATIGDTKVTVLKGTASSDIRVTLKRVDAKDLDDDDSAVLVGSEIVSVEVTDESTNSILSRSELKKPLLVQTRVREDSPSSEHYVAIITYSENIPAQVDQRTAILGSELQDGESSSLYLASVAKTFRISAARFNFAVVYNSAVDARFRDGRSDGTGTATGSGSGAGGTGTGTVTPSSGSFALDTNFGSNGLSVISTIGYDVQDSLMLSDTEILVVGSIVSGSPDAGKGFVAKVLMGPTGATFDTNFDGDGISVSNMGAGEDNVKIVKVRRSGDDIYYLRLGRDSGNSANSYLSMHKASVSNLAISGPVNNVAFSIESSSTLDFQLVGTSFMMAIASNNSNDTQLIKFNSMMMYDGIFGFGDGIEVIDQQCSSILIDSSNNVFVGCPSSSVIHVRKYSSFGVAQTSFNNNAGKSSIQQGNNSASIFGMSSRPNSEIWYHGWSAGSGSDSTFFQQNLSANGQTGTRYTDNIQNFAPQRVAEVGNTGEFYYCGYNIADNKLEIAKSIGSGAGFAHVKATDASTVWNTMSGCHIHTGGVIAIPRGGNQLVVLRATR